MCRTGFFKLGCLCLLFGEVVVRWWVCWSRGCIHWERGRDGAGDVGGSSTRKDSDQRDAVRWDGMWSMESLDYFGCDCDMRTNVYIEKKLTRV
jgi:hypothetical protein